MLAAWALATAASAQLAPIGLSEVRGQMLPHDDGTPGGDQLGWAVASGDFNGDGAFDFASGAPFADGPAGSGFSNVGSVAVRYGQVGRGLRADLPATHLQQPLSESNANEYFGSALAAGDFDGDGYDNLAVGIAADQPQSRGAVRIYFGGSAGLDLAGAELLRESDAGEPQHECANAQFGWSLAAGNFDADAYTDLAIGAHGGCEQIGDMLVAGGSVVVAHGTAAGLLPFFGYRMSQHSFGFDPVEAGDHFGGAVAAGDFDSDDFDDLAIGIPGESGHGALQIVMGSEFGLIFADNATWYPGALGESPEGGDLMGQALAVADFDGDGHDDLAIGSPGEDFEPGGPIQGVGKIAIAYGAPPPAWFDLGRTDRLWQSDIHGDTIHEGEFDAFGSALAAGDFDGDGLADLAVGHPFDDWSANGHGNVTIVMGHLSGIAASGRHRLLATGWEGIPGDSTQVLQDSGRSLATGDFDGDGFADLAIGVPSFDTASATDAGAATILYGALFADGFEVGSTGRWSSTQP